MVGCRWKICNLRKICKTAAMTDLSQAFGQAMALATSGDPTFYEIVGLSLRVSSTSAALACLFGIPLGAWLAVSRFKGRSLLISIVNAALGVPSVRRATPRRGRAQPAAAPATARALGKRSCQRQARCE